MIEKLDKKANVVDVIEVFMAFSKWIEYRSTIDPEVTPELSGQSISTRICISPNRWA